MYAREHTNTIHSSSKKKKKHTQKRANDYYYVGESSTMQHKAQWRNALEQLFDAMLFINEKLN